MVDHRYTRETVRQFMSDAQKTLEQISRSPVLSVGSIQK
jgi:hypothetical protein